MRPKKTPLRPSQVALRLRVELLPGMRTKWDQLPIHRCKYIETTLKTVQGYQAWEVLLKLSEQNLAEALEVAKCLGFDLVLMAELLPVGILGMRQGGNDKKTT